MTAVTSILLRSPSPSPSPLSSPLPALQTDLSSSSSSASGSCLDLHRSSSAPSSRRIRFAPLPDPRRDFFDSTEPASDDPLPDDKDPPHTLPAPSSLPDGSVALSPSISPVSTLSSARSTPTIRISPNSSKNTQKSSIDFFRHLSFLRGSRSSSPSQSSLHSVSDSRFFVRSSSSLPSSPSFQTTKLPTRSLFRTRSESTSGFRPSRPSSPPPKPNSSKFLHRPASPGPTNIDDGKRDAREGSSQLHNTTAVAGSGPKKRRASSSALTPGAGGGRHASVKSPLEDSARPSTAPSSPAVAPKKHVKMLNGRIYGAKRYAAQTRANPFANVRDEPEFVEWGYGGMGSMHASAGIGNDMWKGLQRSERGSALLAGSSFGPQTLKTSGSVTVGGGRGSGASANLPIARRKMSTDVPECSMGSVGSPVEEDDGSGMGWVKRRRAEREAKVRLEQEALSKKPQEGRKSGDSMDASMYESTTSTSTTTSLTACTSAASTSPTTPATSPLTSRSPSLVDLSLTSTPPGSYDIHTTMAGEQSRKSETSVQPTTTSKEGHEHHVLTAVRLSPTITSTAHKHSHSATHGRIPSLSHTLASVGESNYNGIEPMVPLSPVDTEETTTSADSVSGNDDEGSNRSSDEGEAEDDEEEVQDTKSKTALGAGVEKISRHVDVEAR